MNQLAYQYLDIFDGKDGPWAILMDCACKFEGTYRSVALVHRFSAPGGNTDKAVNEWAIFKQAIEGDMAVEHEVEVMSRTKCFMAYKRQVKLFLDQQTLQVADAPAALTAMMLAEVGG